MNCKAGSLKSWINKDPYALGINKYMKRNILYFRKMHKATPSWADKKAIAAIYKECKELRKLGFDYVVDHIVPLNHPYVQGLHWEGNLQIITYKENEAKSNYWWPDMPNEQQDLFGIEDCEQYELF